MLTIYLHGTVFNRPSICISLPSVFAPAFNYLYLIYIVRSDISLSRSKSKYFFRSLRVCLSNNYLIKRNWNIRGILAFPLKQALKHNFQNNPPVRSRDSLHPWTVSWNSWLLLAANTPWYVKVVLFSSCVVLINSLHTTSWQLSTVQVPVTCTFFPLPITIPT